MKTYLKLNIIEFVLIGALIFGWYQGVVEVIGLGIFYIMVSTREKWVTYNKFKRLSELMDKLSKK